MKRPFTISSYSTHPRAVISFVYSSSRLPNNLKFNHHRLSKNRVIPSNLRLVHLTRKPFTFRSPPPNPDSFIRIDVGREIARYLLWVVLKSAMSRRSLQHDHHSDSSQSTFIYLGFLRVYTSITLFCIALAFSTLH